jgi:gliding motility-associated-like protein
MRLFWGDGNQSTASPDTHSYADSGLYTISLTTVSNLGCESTLTEQVRVHPMPAGEIEVLNVCENSTLEIKSTNTGTEPAYYRIELYDTTGISYYINPDSSALHSFDSSGNSEVNFILHMVNDAGCKNQNTYTIPLDTATNVLIQIDTLENQTLKYRFTGIGDNIQSWKWTSSKGHSSDERIWEIQFDETGSVIITLTATNINGCETVLNIPFSVEYFIHFFVPTAFSPNGDGHNDWWKVEGMLFFKEFNLKVYNRWGQQIWESNDANKGWDGSGVPTGTYTYILNATDILNKTYEDKGVLFLER